MLMSQKNPTYFYVANVTNGYADADPIDVDTMPNNSIVFAKVGQNVAGGIAVEKEALVSGQLYQVITKSATGEVKVSPAFKSGDILSKGYKAYEASQEQVSYFGHSGTAVTGLGTLVAGDTYSLGITLKHTAGTVNNSPEIKHIPYYAAVATQSVAAKAMMLSGINLLKGKNILVDRFALTTSVAVVDTDTTSVIYKLTNGSKTVSAYTKTVAASAALTASTVTVAADAAIHIASYGARSFTFNATDADHVIYIGTTSYVVPDAGTAADGSDNQDTIVAAINAGTQATAVASSTATVTITYRDGQYYLPPMVISDADGTPANVAVTAASGDLQPVTYKVAATTSAAATFELDVAWQGPTGYLYASTGATTTSTIGVATLTSDTWGLKFSGRPSTFNPKLDDWTKVEFDLFSDSFSALDTEEYKKVVASLGSGNYQQIQQMENLYQGNDKLNYYADSMTDTREFVATAGKYYEIYSINLNQTPFISPTTGIAPNNPFTILIAVANSVTSNDAFSTVLGL